MKGFYTFYIKKIENYQPNNNKKQQQNNNTKIVFKD